MTDLTLQVDLDLPLDTNEILRYEEMIDKGASPHEAAGVIAQGVLGHSGAIVHMAEAVET